MILIDEARTILLKAWSIRLAIVAALFSGAEAALQFVDAETLGIPHGAMAAIASIVALGAAVSRIVAQPGMHSDK